MVKSLRLSTVFFGIFFVAFYCFGSYQDKFISYTAFSSVDWLESRLSQGFQQSVHIDSLAIKLHGFRPQLELSSLTINSPEGIEHFKAKKVVVGLDWLASVLTQHLVIGDLTLEGAFIKLRELGQGKIAVNDIPSLQADLHSLRREKIDALLELFLSHGDKTFKDVSVVWYDQTGHVVAPLMHLNLSAKSYILRHHFFADAITWDGRPIRFQGLVYGTYLAKHHLLSQTKVSIKGLGLASNPVLMRFMTPIAVQDGVGDIRVQVLLRPDHAQLKGSLQIRQLQLKSLAMKTYHIPTLRTQFNFQSRFNQMRLYCHNVELKLDDELWPTHNIVFNQTTDPHHKESAISADTISLEKAVAIINDNHLVSANNADALQLLKPKGKINHFNLVIQSPIGYKTNYYFSGDLKDVSVAPWHRWPGLTHLNGQFKYAPTQGSFKLDSHDMTLNYSSVFRQSIPLRHARASLAWQRTQADTWSVNLKNSYIETRDGTVSGNVKLLLPINGNKIIQSNAKFVIDNLRNAAKYYPINVLSTTVIQWLDSSIKEGSLTKGEVILNGPLKDFPFDKSNGMFRVSGQLHQGVLKFRKSWPELRKLEAGLLFQGRSMRIAATKGTILGARIHKINADIPNLAKPLLVIDGVAETEKKQHIDIDPDSNPLAELSTVFDKTPITMDGAWKLGLHLQLPLAKNSDLKTVYQGNLYLDNVAMQMHTNPMIKHLRGNLMFADSMAQTDMLQGELFAKPFHLSLSPKNGITQANFQYGQLIDGFLLFNNQFNFERGEISLGGQKAKSPSITGLTVTGTVPEFDLSFWVQQWKSLRSSLKASRVNHVMPVLSSANIMFEKFKIGSHMLTQLNVQAHSNDGGLSMFLDNEAVRGNIKISTNYPSEPIKANLQYLKLIPNALSQNTTSPGDFPALDLSIANCFYKDKHINHIDLKVRPSGNDLIIKQFTIAEPLFKLTATGLWQKNLTSQKTTLSGSLDSSNLGAILNQWHMTDNLVKTQGVANFSLSIADSPFNMTPSKLQGHVNLDFKQGRIIKLNNQANLGMGFGRILNIFSLQALPKRLMLDFSDLTDQGFSFDELHGQAEFKAGDVITDNVTLEGTVAKVRVNGRIGLAKKDYNLRLTINPNVTSSLPVVATLTAGPIAGAVTWVADKLLSHQMKKMTEIHYTVKGSWSNPDSKTTT